MKIRLAKVFCYFFDVILEMESPSSPSVSPKNRSVLLEPECADEMFFMLVDFVRDTVDFRSIVELFEVS